ncbi:hypothetical protein HRI_005144900 [Hibiscus trionum]|uniref:MADS-box domain-containing protein n=1 Tax=Hibiscus trionum TaxID=183268 RepID=A0A9W7MV49_HIBTR|nr:hypothetical protein HRI_005144900 [Hibiscus trionum]
MTRRKVSLAWIENNSSRRSSLKKRRLGLIKKVSELATLCGIEACLIIYSPQENEPMVWPSLDEVKRLVGKFYLVPEHERSKKAMNMEMYMKDKFSKEQEHLMKLNKKNKEVEVGKFMLQMHQGKLMDAFNVNELDALIWFGETRRTNIRKRVEYHKQVPYSTDVVPSEGDVALQLQPPPQVPATATATYDIGGASTAGIRDNNQRATGEFFLWDNWFHNIMNADEFRGGANNNSSSRRSDTGLTHCNPYVATSSTVSLHLGLPGSSYGASSSIAPELSLPRSSRAATEHGPPRPPFDGSSSSVAASELGLPRSYFGGSSRPPFGTFSSLIADADLPEGGYFDAFGGHDMGPGHYPLGPVGSSSPTSEFGGNPLEFFGGESNSSAAASSEIGPSDSNN